jgi:phosphoglycerate-specific signal transduction histidine kinase
MWKEAAATEPPKTATAKPVTEDELRAIFDRLDAAREISRQNRELREVLSRLETETQALRSRNAELEEIMRKFAPTLLHVATTMCIVARPLAAGRTLEIAAGSLIRYPRIFQ